MEQAHSWETCKENVQPIKRGRSTKGLGKGFTTDRVEALEEQEAAFERGIAGLSDSRQLLDAYVQYFKWTRDAFPSSSDKAQHLLERATAELKDNAELKNEPRFVKMWIEYADMVRTPGEIFSFMQSNKIGERVALFWIAWAFVAEKAENFKLTDQIFQKGLQKVSTLKERERHDEALISRARGEKELLSKRYHQFQRRLARHYINQASDAAVTADEHQTDRVALGGLRSGDAVRQPTNENATRGLGNAPRGNEGTRSALPATNPGARAAASSATVVAASTASRATAAAPSSSNNFEIFSDGPPVAAPRQASDSAAVGSGFQIFSDDALPQLAENPSWKQLAPQHVSRKENEGRTTKWTEGGLRGTAAAVPGSASFANQPPPPAPPSVFIPIFCDPEPESKPTFGGAREEENEQRSRGIRFDLDGASARGRGAGLSATQHDHILHDPLQRHKDKAIAPAPVPVPASSSSTKIPRKQPNASAVPAASVLVHASPAAVIARNTTAPPAPASNGFQIFADSPAPAPPKPAAAPASVSMPNNRHEQSELDALLGEMGILDADAEDGTINTKIARQHIDALFFSPSQASPSGSALMSATGGAPSTGQHSGKLFSAFNTTIDLSAIKEVRVFVCKISTAPKLF